MLRSFKNNLTPRFVNTPKFQRDGLFGGKRSRCTLLITRRLEEGALDWERVGNGPSPASIRLELGDAALSAQSKFLPMPTETQEIHLRSQRRHIRVAPHWHRTSYNLAPELLRLDFVRGRIATRTPHVLELD